MHLSKMFKTSLCFIDKTQVFINLFKFYFQFRIMGARKRLSEGHVWPTGHMLPTSGHLSHDRLKLEVNLLNIFQLAHRERRSRELNVLFRRVGLLGAVLVRVGRKDLNHRQSLFSGIWAGLI